MENRKRPGAHAAAMEGKGFYIVLFLCAAVVGASAWMLLSGTRTNVDEIETFETTVDVSDAVVTMLPADTPAEMLDDDIIETAILAQEEETQAAQQAADEEDPVQDVFVEAATSYVWPVQGEIEVPYAVETLLYDATMADWRTHDGVDIACALGEQVIAAGSGLVVSVKNDDLLGTVVEIDHANGLHSIYANLASEPPVKTGDIVTMGQVIGSVGGTALGETNEVPHLHLAMTYDGFRTDPLQYLPGGLPEE